MKSSEHRNLWITMDYELTLHRAFTAVVDVSDLAVPPIHRLRHAEMQALEARAHLVPDCPALVMGGKDDPITAIEGQMDIAAALPASFERFANCGHGIVPDALDRGTAVIREFIARESRAGGRIAAAHSSSA